MVKLIIFVFVVAIIAIIITSILVPSEFWDTIGLQLSRVGRLQIGNDPPTVPRIYINGKDCMVSTCSFTGSAGSSVSMTITANVSDINGNCNNFLTSPTAYLCIGTGTCDEGEVDFLHTVTLSTMEAQYGPGGRFCNFTSTESIDYYEDSGDWRINATAYDGQYYGSNIADWTNAELAGFEFPISGEATVDYGVLNLNQWNDGLPVDGNISWNSGNVDLNITWNATNFTETFASPPYAENEIIPVNISTTSYYIIDNDGTRGSGGTFEEYLMELTPVEAYPSGGFGVCTTFPCSIAEPGKQLVYWHLYIGTGKVSGFYENAIEINSQKY